MLKLQSVALEFEAVCPRLFRLFHWRNVGSAKRGAGGCSKRAISRSSESKAAASLFEGCDKVQGRQPTVGAGKETEMKRYLPAVLALLAVASPAQSFELEGFRSGMTIAEIKTAHPEAVVKPYDPSVFDVVIGSRYEFQTCHGRVHSIVLKTKDLSEFFKYIKIFQYKDGPADIEIDDKFITLMWYSSPTMPGSWRLMRYIVNDHGFVEELVNGPCDEASDPKWSSSKKIVTPEMVKDAVRQVEEHKQQELRDRARFVGQPHPTPDNPMLNLGIDSLLSSEKAP